MRLVGRSGQDSLWVEDPINGLEMLVPRKGFALGGEQPNGDRPVLTSSQLDILRSIAIAAAGASILSGLLVGWWFVRMKRSFRHQYV